MDRKWPQSRVVRIVMPDSTEAEMAEASENWFEFLRILHEIAKEQLASRDSPPHTADDRVEE